MSAHLDFVTENTKYAATFDKGGLGLPTNKKCIIITCMDARVDPASQLGMELGDVHVIRNAGGMAKDALRSVIISQRLLGTREIAVLRHTGCGMLTFSTEQLRGIVKNERPGNREVAEQVDNIEFLEFPDLKESLKSDVKFLQENPLVLEGTEVTGWVYSVQTGKVEQIV